jgi:cob(I)alamin adenosyltransferase
MGYRLSKIYTRTGDEGETGLADGSRVLKDSPRIEAMGNVDELNSVIGLLLTEELPEDTRLLLTGLQHDLFDLGGELAVPGHPVISANHVAALERALDRCNADLPALKDFVLPGGSRAAALAHLARTVSRRAERSLVTLVRVQPVSEFACPYLNRLSDLLFVLARHLNRNGGNKNHGDVLWQPGQMRS